MVGILDIGGQLFDKGLELVIKEGGDTFSDGVETGNDGSAGGWEDILMDLW